MRRNLARPWLLLGAALLVGVLMLGMLFVLVRSSTPDKVLPRISDFGGAVIHSSLSNEAEQTLQDALVKRAAA